MKTNERNWREHPMMSVSGCIDSQGAITASASKEIEHHTQEQSRGKRWRFCVWSQDFSYVAPRTVEQANNMGSEQLSMEEYFTVCDWLIRHGFADDEILPLPETPTQEGGL